MCITGPNGDVLVKVDLEGKLCIISGSRMLVERRRHCAGKHSFLESPFSSLPPKHSCTV